MADPNLLGQYPVRGLYQALAVAAMCLQEDPALRPLIVDVVTALILLRKLTTRKLNPSRTRPVSRGRVLPRRRGGASKGKRAADQRDREVEWIK